MSADTYGRRVHSQFTSHELGLSEEYPPEFDAALEPWKAADPDNHWYQVHRDEEYANGNGPQWRVRLLEDGMQAFVWGTRVEWVAAALRAQVVAFLTAHQHDLRDTPEVWEGFDDE